MEQNHIVFIVMDSCRYDSFMAAKTPNIDKLGPAEKRYAYASWTAPSHYAFTMGMLPHASPKNVFASEVYKEEFVQWTERTGDDSISFRDFLPELSLPKVLNNIGYRTIARVSMPVLNQATLINKYFDDFKLMNNHNDFAGMVDEITFPDDESCYFFLNLGETHYPYMLKDSELPRISGVHGVFKNLDDDNQASNDKFFDDEKMKMLHGQQIKCVEYIDNLIGQLMEKAPANTYFIITADHGELFGEDGYFGHGPIMHEKCFEIPFVEGKLKP
ncbi:MAG: sulfatase-like hydrolase/transferase [Gammaproteobacteria bacterium]|nr:sulfatase-like hydrolase/transferase [Gammaproteobacteria bacterium]